MTRSWSPDVTGTSAENRAVAQSRPLVPDLELFGVMKIPFTVPEPLMSKVAGEALVMLWEAGSPGPHATRVDWL